MKKSTVFIIILAALALSACGGTSQEAAVVEEPVVVETEPIVVEEVQQAEPAAEEAVVAEEPIAAEPAAVEPTSASGMTSYTSPEGIFTLDVPAGWAKEMDNSTIEDAVIETFTAPDGHAYVQIIVNKISPDTSAVLKGQYTLDYMKRLCGEDLRVGKDVTLDDGREKLEWWSDMNKTSGTAYFDTEDNNLFIVNMYYEDAYEDTYKSMLEDVADSFAR